MNNNIKIGNKVKCIREYENSNIPGDYTLYVTLDKIYTIVDILRHGSFTLIVIIDDKGNTRRWCIDEVIEPNPVFDLVTVVRNNIITALLDGILR